MPPSTPTSPRQLHTPVRRLRTNSTDSDHSGPRGRTRFNSREFNVDSISERGDTIFELEQHQDNLMPLECWKSNKMTSVSYTVFLTTYVALVLGVQLGVSTIFLATEFGSDGSSPWKSKLTSWTVTNAIHLLVTVVYIHWLKGSFLLVDEQGELNAMTAWEQLEAQPNERVAVRRTLLTVPTVLAYTACVTCHFEPATCLLNVVLWSIAMLAKLPFMNGVRIFGINRTAGIDDFSSKHL